jgi:hypothetical protein
VTLLPTRWPPDVVEAPLSTEVLAEMLLPFPVEVARRVSRTDFVAPVLATLFKFVEAPVDEFPKGTFA